MYVIHTVRREHVIPTGFCLLRRKNEITYQDMTNKIIRFAPTWNPENLLIDFKKAPINDFPQASFPSCYFHLRQSIHRQLQVWLLHLTLEHLSGVILLYKRTLL